MSLLRAKESELGAVYSRLNDEERLRLDADDRYTRLSKMLFLYKEGGDWASTNVSIRKEPVLISSAHTARLSSAAPDPAASPITRGPSNTWDGPTVSAIGSAGSSGATSQSYHSSFEVPVQAGTVSTSRPSFALLFGCTNASLCSQGLPKPVGSTGSYASGMVRSVRDGPSTLFLVGSQGLCMRVAPPITLLCVFPCAALRRGWSTVKV